jgi:hypothetical protein
MVQDIEPQPVKAISEINPTVPAANEQDNQPLEVTEVDTQNIEFDRTPPASASPAFMPILIAAGAAMLLVVLIIALRGARR